MMKNKNWVHTRFVIGLCWLVLFHAAHAGELQTQGVKAEGIAAIGAGGRDEARKAALADALQQAALSVESRVTSSEHLNAGSAEIQSLHVRPTQEVTHYSILREWEDHGLYHVAVSADVGQGKAAAVGCLSGPHAPKKKITFVKFRVANSIQVDDIKNIYAGFPTELANRMEASGEFLPTYYDHQLILNESEMQKRVDIRVIAEESGAQFVVSGTIVDAGIDRSQGFLGSDILGSVKRNFEVEFSVYDGLTGTRVLQRKLGERSSGEVRVGRDKPFGSGAFFETELGRAASRLMNRVAKDISTSLECIPFAANVVRIEGKKVFLDAGSTSLLSPGDKLVAYDRNLRRPIVGLGGAMLGYTESSLATVTLVQVQPKFSIGELSEEAVKLGIKVGDIVRFESTDGK